MWTDALEWRGESRTRDGMKGGEQERILGNRASSFFILSLFGVK